MALKENQAKDRENLKKIMEKAIKKIHGKKENDLCKYLPGSEGGYIHHFTLRKLKKLNPTELFSLIERFIIDTDIPSPIEPKPRAPRGSRKRQDFVHFNRTDIERVLALARQIGDTDLLARFSPKRSLPSLKRELIRNIRDNQINQDLWNAYSETIYTLEATESYTEK
ncbi:MAG: hypothetical protein R3E91_01875 [Chlamydiales bacterium]